MYGKKTRTPGNTWMILLLDDKTNLHYVGNFMLGRKGNQSLRQSALYIRQRLLQVRQNILDVLNSDGEAHQAVGDAGAQAFIGRHWGVGHAGGVLDEGIHVAQADGQGYQPQAVHQFGSCIKASLEFEGDHSAEIVHLTFGDLVARVGFQAGEKYLGGLGVAVQVTGHLGSVGAVTLHAEFEGSQPDVGEPGVEWAGRAAGGCGHQFHGLGNEFRVGGHHCAADN